MRCSLALLILVGLCFGCSDAAKKESIKLNDKAIRLYWKWHKDRPETKVYADSSLSLLSEAIKLDSFNRAAQWNKLAFENGMKRFKDAKRTAETYFRIFHNPDMLLSLGVINNQLGDSIEAKKNFKQSLTLYQNQIREHKVVEDSILFALSMAYHMNADEVKAEMYFDRYRKTKIGSRTFEKIDFDSLIRTCQMQEKALTQQ